MAQKSGNEVVWSSSFGVQRLWSLLGHFVSYDRPQSALASLEDQILQAVSCPYLKFFVDIGMERCIWTLVFNSDAQNIPLLLLHGMGTGVALWVLSLSSLSRNRPVFAIDILGFGQSSRTSFSADPVVAEMEFIESIEAWRRKMNLETFILLGHCFGGFLAASYAISYPDRVRHLILVDPWGFSDHAQVGANYQRMPMPAWVRTLGFLIQPFNPLALLRAARSWGPTLVKKFKPDLIRNYEDLVQGSTIAEYIYEWNALLPTGEIAFKHMMHNFGWALFPMINRVKEIADQVPITNIFGSRSWIDSSIGQQMKKLRGNSYVETQIVSGTGHYVFAEKSNLFNRIVNRTCLLVDYNLDLTRSKISADKRYRSRSESTPDLRSRSITRRSLTRHRLERSVCLAEEENEEQSEFDHVTTSPLPTLPKPVFNISYED